MAGTRSVISTRLSSYTPNFIVAFSVLLTIRLLSAVYNLVADCDETFNYWEPTHYLLYGYGFQTWEYSPEYGIRSYSYILLHAAVGKLSTFFVGDNKIAVFYAIRAFLGAFCAFSETIFYCGLVKKFGANIAKLCLLIMAFSSGMFISSTAYLPSSFSMYGVMLAFGCWFGDRLTWALTMAAFSCIGGWPFTGIVFLPLGFDILYKRGFFKVIWWSTLSFVYFLLPAILIDYFFYKKLSVCVWNIAYYNATANAEGGSQLFGVEPWTFYVKNLFINFNVVFLLAIPALLIAVVLRGWEPSLRKLSVWQIVTFLLPSYLWMAFMFYLPHKEERFLFVIYPLICFCAALSIILLSHFIMTLLGSLPVFRSSDKTRKLAKRLFICSIVILFIVLSTSRAVSLTKNYGTASGVYKHLSFNELQNLPGGEEEDQVNICVGKEWYRFPSNFFLPSKRFKLQFVKSAFTGQLPQPFTDENGTSGVPSGFNNLNKEETDRYVPVETCDYMVDFYLPDGVEEQYLADTTTWSPLVIFPFLDSERSESPFYRAFYFPGPSDKYNAYGKYYLVKRNVSKLV